VLRGASGEPVRMIGIGMDITERRRLEDELRARAHQLVEQDRRKDEFLAILSHELRNPLAPVTTALALLEAKQHDPQAVDSLRRVIERQIWHLVRLIDDLLETSRITTGKIELRTQRVELREIALAAVEAVQDLVSARSQDLEVETGAQPILLDGDPTRLSQVIFNLLNNASAYTPEGGRIQVALRRDGDEVLLTVRDNGVGMSPDTIRQAFELFARGTSPEHAGSGGLGVGLALVRRLVELHGGSVSAHSEGPGRGTEVTVRLPAAEAAERPPEDRDRPSLHARRAAVRRRILVVDDNVDAAETLAALLELQGHRVAVAHDGERALELAREFVPDIALLDLGMPGMDGYELARAFRDNPSTRGVQIIAVSGYGRAEDRARTRQAGFDMHVTKPVDPEVLRKVVEGPSPSADPVT
jgi:CheY-like chemotaxis protein